MKGNRFESDVEVIITSEEIKIILDRYRIGKKPLAKLLGWGETTIIRYMEGDIPTNEYSNKLKAILNDPEFYYDLLTKRKDCLTGVAYKKSKKAVLGQILSSKICAIAYYIVNKSNAEISPSYIQYLLYYIQAFSLALYDRELFQDEYAMNVEQVPYLKIYEGMKRCGIHTLELTEDFLSSEEKELIDAIYDSFAWFGLKALTTLHLYEKSFLRVSRDRFNNKVLSKDTITEYFKDIIVRYEINELSDVINYPKERLLQIGKMNLLA